MSLLQIQDSRIICALFLVYFIINSYFTAGHQIHTKQKRQLFRENLLPELGGKIPEHALRPERIALNRFNQNGLYSPDGIYVEQSHSEKHPVPSEYIKNTLKIMVPVNNNHVAPVGQYYGTRIVDTTYLIREPAKDALIPYSYRYSQTIPLTSLKLLRYYKQRRLNGNHRTPWNDVFNANDFSRILMEFSPYLAKLHEYDK